jgi:hypothetical protein
LTSSSATRTRAAIENSLRCAAHSKLHVLDLRQLLGGFSLAAHRFFTSSSSSSP